MAEMADRLESHINADLLDGLATLEGKPRLDQERFVQHRKAVAESIENAIATPATVNKGVSGDFILGLNNMGMSGLAMQLAKDISSTSPLNTTISQTFGFVPFDLSAPAKLLYPVKTPLRQKLPRTRGQGNASMSKRVTGISGSGTAGNALLNPFTSELAANQTMSGNWPMTDMNAIGLTADMLVVPYKIQSLDHNVSFLAQFEGQGYQDIVGLATLTLLQSMMLSEENALISARSTNLGAAGTIASTAPRSAVGGETGFSAAGTIWVSYTARNAFGHTAPGGTVAGTVTTGQVFDFTLPNVTGAEWYDVYVGAGVANPGTAAFFYGSTAWNKVTVQGPTAPTTGTAIANVLTDSGTGSSNAYDGLISILSGGANSTYDPNSLGLNSGYTLRFNGGSGGSAAFSYPDVQAAFSSMWNKNKSEPDEIWLEGGDRQRLSDQILANGAAVQAYRVNIEQAGAGAVRAGVVVTEILNEVVGKSTNLTVHPWLHQGNALLMSYQLPMPYAEVPNCWEVRNIQDYLSIAWPVIDKRFRYSILQYGALVGYAPQFSGIIQGIPKSNTQPYL